METLNQQLTGESVEVIESVLPKLIERHLQWVPVDESPTASLTAKQYGLMPRGLESGEGAEYRPGREPVDFRLIAGKVLGLDPESPRFEDEVRNIDGHFDLNKATDLSLGQYTGRADVQMGSGWYSFLTREGMSPEEIKAMKEVSEDSYRLNTLTEDNLPSYVLETMGTVRTVARELGIPTVALDEWFRGLWPAEEDGHKIAMNDYGQIRRLTTTPEHVAGRNSQLRAGTAVHPSGLIEVFCYTPRQEFETKLAHQNDGLLFGPVGGSLLRRISQDETRHEDVYSGVLKALLDNDKLTAHVIKSLKSSYENFFMPGLEGIPNFNKRAINFERARIFGRAEDFESAKHILKKIGILGKFDDGSYAPFNGLDAAAEEDLQWLRDNFDREFEQPERRHEPAFVLGKTITVSELRKLRRTYASQKGLSLNSLESA